MAAPENPRGLGLPGPARVDNGAAIHFTISRKAVQLWVSRVPGPGRSGGDLEDFAARRDRCAAHGRIHDGPGSECECVGSSPSRLHVLQCGREYGRSLRFPVARRWNTAWLTRQNLPGIPQQKTRSADKSGILARIWEARLTNRKRNRRGVT